MDSPLVSIIIPVHNVEKYLRKCLDSVLAQTYPSLEILVVNDASPDGSEAILAEYAAKDERVRIFTLSSNQGVSAARNVGLDMACGKYVQFVDSDDQLASQMCEHLVHIAERTHADQVKCGFCLVDQDGKEIRRRSPRTGFFDLTQADERRIAFEHSRKFFLVWNGLFLRKTIHDLRMDLQAMCSEDILFGVQAFLRSTRIVTIPDVLYSYVQQPQSLMHTPTLAKSLGGIYAVRTIFNEAYQTSNTKAFYDSLWTLLWNQGRGIVIHYMAASAHSASENDHPSPERILWNDWKNSMRFAFSESGMVPAWWRWFYRYAFNHDCSRLFFTKIFAPGNLRRIRACFLHPGDFFVILKTRANFAKKMNTKGVYQ